jgi:ribosomal-protein-alanine N-acetyltransferase
MLLSPPDPYHLRPMQLADLPRVQQIESSSFPTPWPLAGYRHELLNNERAYYVVLTCAERTGEERIVGYAGHWLIADEVHISTIAVEPRLRGHGLGALLLLQMVAHGFAQGASLVTLEVRSHNAAAQALYRSHRFAVVGLRRGYYKDTGEDAILMTLSLEDEDIQAWLTSWQAQLWARLEREAGTVSPCI